MNALGRILSFWFALAFLVLLAPTTSTSAQDLFQAAPLPEGIAATGDTTEVRTLTAWAEEHRYRHPNQARQIAERALTLAQTLNDQPGIGKSLMLLGNLVFSSDLSQAEAYFLTAQKVFEQLNDQPGFLHARTRLGGVYGRRGQIDQALPLLFDVLSEFERLGDISGQAGVLNNIGNSHKYQGNHHEALVHYKQALQLVQRIGDSVLEVSILNNIGIVYAELSLPEQSEEILLQALDVAETLGAQFEAAFTSNNLASSLIEQGQYEHALPHLFRAEEVAKELGESIFLSVVYVNLAKAFLGLDQYDRALEYAAESLHLVEEARGDPRYMMWSHQTLSQIYEAAGNDRQALIHHQRYATVKDSVLNIENAGIIAEMQARYETEEKQREIARLEQEKRIQALQRTLLLVGVVGLLLLLGVLYYRYQTKQKANRLLEEVDRAKSRFFANISHEFRTPLTVILGGLRDLLAGRFGETNDRIAEQHHAMLRNTRQLQRLINEVLDLNRLEAGHLEVRLEPGDLVQSLRNIVEAHAPLAERNGITLTLVCDAQTCYRLYDEEKLEKIVGNLLSNALKFTPREGYVRVKLRSMDQVEISVTDDGPGIPVDTQTKVFERFAQLDQGVLKGGTGIGLALAKELTELHSGTITLISEPGDGSTFTVRLPLERATLPVVQERASREVLESESFETSSVAFTPFGRTQPVDEHDQTTILIIEDNDDVRAYIRRSLEETYLIVEAVNGESAIRQARKALPDIIVSDVMLPDIDGYEIARQLKADPLTECIPVVMLTARAAESDHVAGYDSGAETYITKPFSPETLHAAVARLLEERRRLRRLLQANVTQFEDPISPTHSSTLLDRVRAVILENLHDEDFGVDQLAVALGMSRRTLYRRLKPEVDLSPNDLIWTLRLEHAYRLLSDGAGSVSEIAYAVGFKSLSHFTQSFRERYGVLPSSALNTQPSDK